MCEEKALRYDSTSSQLTIALDDVSKLKGLVEQQSIALESLKQGAISDRRRGDDSDRLRQLLQQDKSFLQQELATLGQKHDDKSRQLDVANAKTASLELKVSHHVVTIIIQFYLFKFS